MTKMTKVKYVKPGSKVELEGKLYRVTGKFQSLVSDMMVRLEFSDSTTITLDRNDYVAVEA